MAEWKAREFLGKRVVVVIDTDQLDLQVKPKQDAVIVTGVLLGIGQGGDFEILEDDGFVHYCWPMLKVKLADDPIKPVLLTDTLPG